MTQEVEIELKNLLTKEEYELLLKQLPFQAEGQKQVNYYFETRDFQLRKHHSALRIPEKNDQYRLTLKEPYKDGLLETHDTLTAEEAKKWMNGSPVEKKATALQLSKMEIQVSDLHYFGSLTTIRREYKENGLLFVLDCSYYHDREDYELEIEATSRELGIEAMNKVLHDWNITKKETPNKIARFFHSL